MDSTVRQLAGLAGFALVLCFLALALHANFFALIFGAESAVAVLGAVLIAE
jgi:hypothetical protein